MNAWPLPLFNRFWRWVLRLNSKPVKPTGIAGSAIVETKQPARWADEYRFNDFPMLEIKTGRMIYRRHFYRYDRTETQYDKPFSEPTK